MTREIKFRAWNRHSKRMIEHNELRGLHFDTVLCAENLMQYTGLKDKNGTEIYEGDIWQDDEGSLGQIKDSNYGWIVTDLDALYDCLAYGKVIGNIYENTELLTEDLNNLQQQLYEMQQLYDDEQSEE